MLWVSSQRRETVGERHCDFLGSLIRSGDYATCFIEPDQPGGVLVRPYIVNPVGDDQVALRAPGQVLRSIEQFFFRNSSLQFETNQKTVGREGFDFIDQFWALDERKCDFLRLRGQFMNRRIFRPIIENGHRHDDREDSFILQVMVEMFPGFVDGFDGVEHKVLCRGIRDYTPDPMQESNLRTSLEQSGGDRAAEAAGGAVADIAHCVYRGPSRTGGDENMPAGQRRF